MAGSRKVTRKSESVRKKGDIGNSITPIRVRAVRPRYRGL